MVLSQRFSTTSMRASMRDRLKPDIAHGNKASGTQGIGLRKYLAIMASSQRNLSKHNRNERLKKKVL